MARGGVRPQRAACLSAAVRVSGSGELSPGSLTVRARLLRVLSANSRDPMSRPKPRSYALVNPNSRPEDADTSVRPLSLCDFTGQREARANLQVYIDSAKARGDALDHVLLILSANSGGHSAWERSMSLRPEP